MSDGVEFVSEAQEIIETLSKGLLELERGIRANEDYDPDLLNSAFRAVHTLKGLASLGAERPGLSQLSHHLENTLDALRLGKLPLNLGALDLLFESVELFGRLLAAETDAGGASEVNIDSFLERLDRFARGEEPEEEVDELAWLDHSIHSVLTEYEEHRLRENVRQGRAIFRVHASFGLLAIDVGLEALKQKMKAYGEVITYLPSADSSSDDRIEMDVLLGSRATLSEIAAGVADNGVSVHAMSGGDEAEDLPSRAPGPGGTTTQRVAPPASVPGAAARRGA